MPSENRGLIGAANKARKDLGMPDPSPPQMVVPREMTADMVRAVRKVPTLNSVIAADYWRVMLSAAPASDYVPVRRELLERLDAAEENFRAYLKGEHGLAFIDTDDHNVFGLQIAMTELRSLLSLDGRGG